MKKTIITYVTKEEFDSLRKKYPRAQYFESKKYRKLKLSAQREVRCYK
jgi:hypothetical protein